MLARAAAEVDLAVTGYLALPALPPESMFEHLYASLPQSLEEQRRAVAAATDA